MLSPLSSRKERRVGGIARPFHLRTWTIVALLVFAAATPGAAFAATFTNEYPAGTANTQPAVVGVTAFGSVAFDTRSPQLSVDGVAYRTYVRAGSASGYWSAAEAYNATLGVWTIRWTWVPTAADPTKATLYAYPVFGTPLSDGVHTVTATIKDVTGAISTDSWTFSYRTPPVIGVPTPADGSVVDTTSPVISVPVTDNDTRPVTATATVNESPATAVVSDGVVRVEAPTLPNDATATVTVTATDGSGASTSRTWSFIVQVYGMMAFPVAECSSCHSTAAVDPDMADDCSLCHAGQLDRPHQGAPAGYHSDAVTGWCSGCHVADVTVEHNRRGLTCLTCHTSGNPAVRASIAAGVVECAACHDGSHAPQHANSVSTCAGTGTGCHNEPDLVAVHAAFGCACHSSADPVISSAIASHDRDCTTCHDAAAVHGAVHDADPAYAAIVVGQVSFLYPRTNEGPWHGAYTRATCVGCHGSSNLLTVHLGEKSCPVCHGVAGPRSSFATWDRSCQQSECHTPTQYFGGANSWTGTPYIQHNDAAATAPHMTVAVTGLDAQGSCIAECHSRGCAPDCHTVKDGTTDTSPPITRASQVSSEPVTWRLSPVDSQSGVASTYYSFDGGTFLPYGANEVANPIANPLDTVRVGQHTLQCYSVDAAGNREATRTITYVTTGVDLTAPTIAMNGIRTGPNSIVATSAALSVRDSMDPGPCSGVSSVRVSYKSYDRFWGYTFGNIYWYPVNHSFPTSAWDTTSTIQRLEDQARAGFGGGTVSSGAAGNYFVIRYYAVDYAGNTSAQAEDSVFIDNAPPTTTPAKVTGAYRWKLNASDGAAGIGSTYYSFDGGPFALYTSQDASAGVGNTSPGGDSAGAHTLSYYSLDGLGNTETTKTLNYAIP